MHQVRKGEIMSYIVDYLIVSRKKFNKKANAIRFAYKQYKIVNIFKKVGGILYPIRIGGN